jgi:phage FluMu protein Com
MKIMYKCPLCNQVSSAKEWNDEVGKSGIHYPIQGIKPPLTTTNNKLFYYQCPKCKEHVYGAETPIYEVEE